jgi:molecular chaperone DnaJ
MNVPHFNDAQSVFDLFGDLFGDIFGQRRHGPQPGRDLQVAVDIDLVEAARGARKTITVSREEICPDCSGQGSRRGSQPAVCQRCQGRGAVIHTQGFFRLQQTCPRCGGRGHLITDPCPSCRGHGRVEGRRSLEIQIPAGVDNGIRIRFNGEGEAGEPGAPRGDLYCVVRVRDHPFFQRDGANLICHVPITISQAALGAEIEVPTLDGTINYPLRPGTQSGDVLRIPGRGMPPLRGSRTGDLLVQVLVETPRNLTTRQEELYRELAEIEQKHVSPQRKSFLEKVRSFFTTEPPADAKEPRA